MWQPTRPIHPYHCQWGLPRSLKRQTEFHNDCGSPRTVNMHLLQPVALCLRGLLRPSHRPPVVLHPSAPVRQPSSMPAGKCECSLSLPHSQSVSVPAPLRASPGPVCRGRDLRQPQALLPPARSPILTATRMGASSTTFCMSTRLQVTLQHGSVLAALYLVPHRFLTSMPRSACALLPATKL